MELKRLMNKLRCSLTIVALSATCLAPSAVQAVTQDEMVSAERNKDTNTTYITEKVPLGLMRKII